MDFPGSPSLPCKYHQFLCLSNDTIVCCETNHKNPALSLIHICRLHREDNTLRWQRSIETPKRVMTMTSFEAASRVVVETVDGAVYTLDNRTSLLLSLLLCWVTLNTGFFYVEFSTLEPWLDSHRNHVTLQPCARIAVCSFDNEQVVVGLTERFRLFINNIQVPYSQTYSRMFSLS